MMTTLILATGAADPPHAGSQTVRISSNTFALPTPPYTLEIAVNEATFPQGSYDPRPAWGIQFTALDLSHTTFWLYADGYYTMPPFVPDSTAFIHIRPTNNQFYLDVQADSTATLRLNHEIAWQGRLPRFAQAEFMPQQITVIPHIMLYKP